MSEKRKQPAEVVSKPFLTGSITDENTVRSALKFFGILVLIFVMTLIACIMVSFGGTILRIAADSAIILLVLFILFNKGQTEGAEAVSRGEILYQRKENGQEFTRGEARLSYHPLKGFLNAFLGTLPVLIPALILALTTQRMMTSAGNLPGWTGSLMRRSEIGDALQNYTQADPMTLTDIVRVIVRICLMPYVSMAGNGNKDLLLLIERLSPLLLLLPGCAYGVGYTAGRKARDRVHTSIAESRRIRIRREEKARRARRDAGGRKGPEQLN